MDLTKPRQHQVIHHAVVDHLLNCDPAIRARADRIGERLNGDCYVATMMHHPDELHRLRIHVDPNGTEPTLCSMVNTATDQMMADLAAKLQGGGR